MSDVVPLQESGEVEAITCGFTLLASPFLQCGLSKPLLPKQVTREADVTPQSFWNLRARRKAA